MSHSFRQTIIGFQNTRIDNKTISIENYLLQTRNYYYIACCSVKVVVFKHKKKVQGTLVTMKLSPIVFRVPRRTASDVLRSAQTAAAAENSSSGNVYFQELPKVLQSFFRRYPPPPFREYSDKPTATNAENANPFLANKHPVTNRWHNPKYSMRRQADLWKAAYRFGIEHLLPPLLHRRTFYEKRYETKKPIRGAQFFKLTASERRAPAREAEIREALANADAKILEKKGKRFKEFLARKKRLEGLSNS